MLVGGEMEVSGKKMESSGQELVETLVSLTGIPEPLMSQEIIQIFEKTGQNPQDITLERLRDAMLVYLEAMQSDLMSEDELKGE